MGTIMTDLEELRRYLELAKQLTAEIVECSCSAQDAARETLAIAAKLAGERRGKNDPRAR